MKAVDDGIAKLESVLGGTRMNAERALRDLHDAMLRDLRAAERRAERAERRVEELRGRLRRVRRRAERLERRLAAPPQPAPGRTRVIARLARKARNRRQG